MPTAAADEALLRAYEPVVRFTEGELFFPTPVGPYVEECSLWARDPEGAEEDAELLLPVGRLTLDALARAGRDHRDRLLQLRFVPAPLKRAALRQWRRQDRPRLRSSGRLAAVGVFTRSIDSLVRLSLLLRGSVPGGLAAAADVASSEHLATDRYAYHGRVTREGGYTVLQDWLYYVFNDWRSTFAGVNDHEGDWEVVLVYLADSDDGRPPVPRWVAASSQDHGGDELRRRWDDPRLQREGDHPVVYAGAGSHSHAFEPRHRRGGRAAGPAPRGRPGGTDVEVARPVVAPGSQPRRVRAAVRRLRPRRRPGRRAGRRGGLGRTIATGPPPSSWGGMVTVSPGKGALGTFAPPLDEAGNSVRGRLAATFLSRSLGLDLFASTPTGDTSPRADDATGAAR